MYYNSIYKLNNIGGVMYLIDMVDNMVSSFIEIKLQKIQDIFGVDNFFIGKICTVPVLFLVMIFLAWLIVSVVMGGIKLGFIEIVLIFIMILNVYLSIVYIFITIPRIKKICSKRSTRINILKGLSGSKFYRLCALGVTLLHYCLVFYDINFLIIAISLTLFTTGLYSIVSNLFLSSELKIKT